MQTFFFFKLIRERVSESDTVRETEREEREREKEGKRAREKHRFVVPLIDACIN